MVFTFTTVNIAAPCRFRLYSADDVLNCAWLVFAIGLVWYAYSFPPQCRLFDGNDNTSGGQVSTEFHNANETRILFDADVGG